MANQVQDYENIFNVVRRWPLAERLHLVQDILQTLTPVLSEPTDQLKKQATLNEALGLLETPQPAPSDKQIEQWLNERRMRKYG